MSGQITVNLEWMNNCITTEYDFWNGKDGILRERSQAFFQESKNYYVWSLCHRKDNTTKDNHVLLNHSNGEWASH